VWISAALNWLSGRFHWVTGPSKNSELFLKLLGELRRTYRCYRRLHLALDNDSSHTSRLVESYVDRCGGRIELHPLPTRCPESNPVELIWWGLHEAVTRNHCCPDLAAVLEFAERYLAEKQPFHLHLGEVYRKLQRSPP